MAPNSDRRALCDRPRAARNAPERLASCERALEEVGDDDALAAHILGLIAMTHWLLGDLAAKGLAAARDGLERAERVGDPPLVGSRSAPSAASRRGCWT